MYGDPQNIDQVVADLAEQIRNLRAGVHSVTQTTLAAITAVSGADSEHNGAGVDSTQVGTLAVATALETTAVGDRAAATAVKASAFGADTEATTDYSLAAGNAALATGLYGTALGAGAEASAEDATAGGNFAIAAGIRSTVYGANAEVTAGDGSIAVGKGALNVTGDDAVVIGRDAENNATNSTVMGSTATADAECTSSLVLGRAASAVAGVVPGELATRMVVAGRDAAGQGTSAIAIGENAFAGDYDPGGDSRQCVAVGAFARASGGRSVGIGDTVLATALEAVAVGTLSEASAAYAAAVGGEALAAGADSAAFGHAAQAIADEASAFGHTAFANHQHSSAVGADAATTKANQMMLGTTADVVTVAGKTVELGADGTVRAQRVTGTPEGTVTASPGSLVLRDDSSAGTGGYLKESGTGNTGWRSIVTSPPGVPVTADDLFVLAAMGVAA